MGSVDEIFYDTAPPVHARAAGLAAAPRRRRRPSRSCRIEGAAAVADPRCRRVRVPPALPRIARCRRACATERCPSCCTCVGDEPPRRRATSRTSCDRASSACESSRGGPSSTATRRSTAPPAGARVLAASCATWSRSSRSGRASSAARSPRCRRSPACRSRRRRRDARARRRVRLRQVDHRAACCCELIDPTSGSVTFDGQDIVAAQGAATCAQLRQRIQIVFQDPYASLNPRMTVGAILAEPLRVHRKMSKQPRRANGSRELLRTRRPQPRARATASRTSSPAVSASASASPARSRSTRADRARRAGVRARRVDPGRRRQPARATCRTSSASRTCSSRTTSRSCATSPTASR